jgi:NADH-quinone oxidoreductase subunit A
MLNPYLGILGLVIIAVGFVATMLVLATFLGPLHKTRTKQLPFECGSVSVGDMLSHRFHVGFYLLAMLFILFDIEVVFMYPWAVVYRELGVVAFYEMLAFVAVLAVGLAYVWKRGVLDWSKL